MRNSFSLRQELRDAPGRRRARGVEQLLDLTPALAGHGGGISAAGAAGELANCSMTLPAGQTCDDARPKLRSFRSFTEAANENGLSRILVGIHFRRAVEEGIEHGRNIGRRAVELFMQPVED